MLSPNPQSLRTHVEPRELAILVFVWQFEPDGYLLRTDLATAAHRYLVEDGYLTSQQELTGAQSYFRLRLTDAGRQALCIKQPCGLTDEERNQSKSLTGEWP